MSDISSTPPRTPSPFERLKSAKVSADEPKKQEPNPERKVDSGDKPDVHIFREVGPKAAGDTKDQQKQTQVLSGLEAAVTDLASSRDALNKASSTPQQEVSSANSAASSADLRDVDKATKLADDLYSRILDQKDRAIKAQDKLSREGVENLLS